mgnify:CR=1 FL=1
MHTLLSVSKKEKKILKIGKQKKGLNNAKFNTKINIIKLLVDTLPIVILKIVAKLTKTKYKQWLDPQTLTVKTLVLNSPTEIQSYGHLSYTLYITLYTSEHLLPFHFHNIYYTFWIPLFCQFLFFFTLERQCDIY